MYSLVEEEQTQCEWTKKQLQKAFLFSAIAV